jgi:hypothetical protein
MLEMTTSAKAYMQKTDPESAVYAIINVDSAIADSKTKAILTDWLEFNSKYVLHAAIINLDGTRKIMYNSILKSLGLKNIKYFPTRQLAVDYLSEA